MLPGAILVFHGTVAAVLGAAGGPLCPTLVVIALPHDFLSVVWWKALQQKGEMDMEPHWSSEEVE